MDFAGNLYFSDEDAIKRVDFSALGPDGVAGTDAATVLFDAGGTDAIVAKPTGVATDGFEVVWANGELGTAKGSLVKGSADGGAGTVKVGCP